MVAKKQEKGILDEQVEADLSALETVNKAISDMKGTQAELNKKAEEAISGMALESDNVVDLVEWAKSVTFTETTTYSDIRDIRDNLDTMVNLLLSAATENWRKEHGSANSEKMAELKETAEAVKVRVKAYIALGGTPGMVSPDLLEKVKSATVTRVSTSSGSGVKSGVLQYARIRPGKTEWHDLPASQAGFSSLGWYAGKVSASDLVEQIRTATGTADLDPATQPFECTLPNGWQVRGVVRETGGES